MKNTDNYNILTLKEVIKSQDNNLLIEILENPSLDKNLLDFQYLFKISYIINNLEIIKTIVNHSPENIKVNLFSAFTYSNYAIFLYILSSEKIILENASISYGDLGIMMADVTDYNLISAILQSNKVKKINKTQDKQHNPLSIAIENNNQLLIDLLFASEFTNLNTIDETNMSALDLAIDYNDVELAYKLITRPGTKNIVRTNFERFGLTNRLSLKAKLINFLCDKFGQKLSIHDHVPLKHLTSLIEDENQDNLINSILTNDFDKVISILFDPNINESSKFSLVQEKHLLLTIYMNYTYHRLLFSYPFLDKDKINFKTLFLKALDLERIDIIGNIIEYNKDQKIVLDFSFDFDFKHFIENTDAKSMSDILRSDLFEFINFEFNYDEFFSGVDLLDYDFLEELLTSEKIKKNIHPDTFSTVLYQIIMDTNKLTPCAQSLLKIIFNTETTNLNKPDEYGLTPLYYAIEEKKWDIVHRIITKPGTIIYQCDIVIAFISSPLLFYKLLSLYNFQIENVYELSTLFDTILQQIPKRSTADQEGEIAVTINDEEISLTYNRELSFNLFHNYILFSLYNAHIKPIIPDNTPVPEEYKNSFQIFAERMHIISKKINEKLDNIESNNFLNERVISLLGKNKILHHINRKIVTTLFFGQSLSNFETRFQKSTLYNKSQKDLFEFYIDSILSKFDQKKDNFVNIASYLPLKDLVRFSGAFLKAEDLREFSYFMTTYYGYVREFPTISTTTTANPQIASPVVYEIANFIPEPEFTVKEFCIEDVKVETIEQSSLPTFSQVIYTGNMIVDAMKLSFTPSFEHAKQLTYSAGTVYSIVQGSSLYSYAIMGAEFTEKAIAGNYKEAVIDLTAKLAVITVISSIGSIGSAALTGYSLYKLLENSDKFLSKINSNEGQIESLQTWGAIYQAFANSPLQYIYDFETRADELFAKAIIIDTTLDFENNYFGM
jgi:hypothetical protein